MTVQTVRAEVFERFRVCERVYGAGTRQPRHSHDDSNITAVIRGELEESTDAGVFRGRSCSVVVKPAGTEHEDAFVGRVPVRAIAIQFRGESDDCASFGWRDDEDAARAAVDLCQAMTRSRPEIESAAEALVAAGATRRGGRAPEWVDDVRALLDSRFDEPIRFETLAREAALHPVYMARAFHRATGSTMGEYLRAARVRKARHLLATTDASLLAVSCGSGFADASHLCRTFRRAMGITPIVFRGLVRSMRG